jgi:hypothetical protein
MKGSRVKPLGIGQEIEVGLMGDNPRLDPIHRDGFPLAARKALHRRRCASAILARPAVVFGPVDSPILSFPAIISNGLVGYWTFDGGSIDWHTNTVADMSGNGNTAYMTTPRYARLECQFPSIDKSMGSKFIHALV